MSEDDMTGQSNVVTINRNDVLAGVSDDELRAYFKIRGDIEERRKEITEELATETQKMVDKGCDRGGLGAAFKRYMTPEYKRKVFDQTYIRATDTLDVQHKLFTDEQLDAESQSGGED